MVLVNFLNRYTILLKSLSTQKEFPGDTKTVQKLHMDRETGEKVYDN